MIATSEYSSVQFNALIRACDHRVCCNINTAHPFGRSTLSQSRAHSAPCTQDHVSVHVFGQLQQIREISGRTATESACKCSSSLSQKQQLKAQIIYHSPFFPLLFKKLLNRSTQIRVQPHSSCLWHFPNPPHLHPRLRARPFRHPAARACHNTWEKESKRKTG